MHFGGGGQSRDLSSDAAATFQIEPATAACGSVVIDVDATGGRVPKVLVATGAKSAGCTALDVRANATLGGVPIVARATLRLAFVESMAVAFGAYPPNNGAVDVDTVPPAAASPTPAAADCRFAAPPLPSHA